MPAGTPETRIFVLAICGLFACASIAAAQSTSPSSRARRGDGTAGSLSADDADPPPPIAPQVVSRGENGRVVVRAVHLTQSIRVDGRLDEDIYGTPAISDFIQTVPSEGAPATEKTDAWVMYDDDAIYVACRCWDSAPPEAWVANEMRRDTNQLRQNDIFGVLFDTFHDRRNGFQFYTNPLGARADQIITDEGNPNTDWNPVWEVRTGRFEGGWTVEMAIPFKSLRYKSGLGQSWGIQMRRAIRRKNEWTHLTALPPAGQGSTSIFRVSAAATMVGLDLPSASRNIEIKPYTIGSVTTDRALGLSNARDGNVGVDGKYGITANLTADVTVNTDFAQVEVDEQQVNLTRFVLNYPEKRDFFLEGRGTFDFGRGGQVAGGNSGGNTSVQPMLFYSRRIGLNRGRVIPLDVGGRITGKVGDIGLGLLNIQTGDETVSNTPSTNFTVLRVKRDILRRSSIGAIFTNRSASTVAPGTNQTYGVDTAFSFFQNVALGGYYARTATPTLEGDADSYQARLDYAPDRYGARFEYLKVGDNFNPEVGLVRRDNFKRSFGLLRFSPRPRSIRSVRKLTWEGSFENFENGGGFTETRIWNGRFNAELQNSDQAAVELTKSYERLVRPFGIATGVTIPVGDYDFSDVQASYGFGQQRPVSGTVSLQYGHFYDGTITALGLSGARVAVTKVFSVEPSVSINRVKLRYGDFTTRLFRARSDYGFSPRMFASGLVQYNSADNTFSSNLRFRWEYSPGSELFVVYTDERDTIVSGFPDLKNRAFVVKINRLWQF
jgi:hypothetical protein